MGTDDPKCIRFQHRTPSLFHAASFATSRLRVPSPFESVRLSRTVRHSETFPIPLLEIPSKPGQPLAMAPFPAFHRVGPFHRTPRCSSSPHRPRPSFGSILFLLVLWLTHSGLTGRAAETSPQDVRALMRLGQYDKAITAAREGLASGAPSEDWPVLLTQGLLTTGRYIEARDVITNATAKARRSIRLRWIGREACLAAGDTNQAASYLDDIRLLVNAQAADLRDPRARVALAQAAFLLGADPKIVLEKVLDPVRQIAPDLAELYLVRGHIALEKHDADLASRAFEQGIQRQKDDPDLHYVF